jgi:predicted metal-binding membrane protein
VSAVRGNAAQCIVTAWLIMMPAMALPSTSWKISSWSLLQKAYLPTGANIFPLNGFKL